MNLIQTNGKLNGYYRRYVDETTTPIEWDKFDASLYDHATLERGRRAWLLRTMDEYRSMVGFSEMTHIAAAMHAPIDVVACSSRVVRDEVRHVEICSTLMDRLGGQKEVNAKPNYVRTNPKHQYRVRAMQLAIGSCCIGETISVIMLAGVREQASDPVAHAALTQMLKDESFHSRFGWLWLESMDLDDRDRRWLDRFIPRVFGSLEPPAVSPGRNAPFIPSPFGAISNKERGERFYTAMDNIIEAFEERGLPGRRWWQQRVQAAT